MHCNSLCALNNFSASITAFIHNFTTYWSLILFTCLYKTRSSFHNRLDIKVNTASTNRLKQAQFLFHKLLELLLSQETEGDNNAVVLQLCTRRSISNIQTDEQILARPSRPAGS